MLSGSVKEEAEWARKGLTSHSNGEDREPLVATNAPLEHHPRRAADGHGCEERCPAVLDEPFNVLVAEGDPSEAGSGKDEEGKDEDGDGGGDIGEEKGSDDAEDEEGDEIRETGGDGGGDVI